MIKKYLVVLVFLGGILTIQAQSKVKGSRIVVDQSESLGSFNRLKVTDGLEVNLLKSVSEGYDLEMDDNLIELIDMTVRDSLLTVSLKKTIRSSKKMNITVRFNKLLEIMVDGKAKVFSQSILETGPFKGTISGNGSLQIEVKASDAQFMINESSKLEIDFRGDTLTMNAKDNAFAEGDINTDTFELIASGRSDIEFKGNANEASLTLDENADFNARSFDGDAVKVILRGSSKATLSADKDVLVDMSDKSILNLYGDPEITVERFTGNATLQKKD